VLAGLSQQDREYAETRVAVAALRFAQDDPQAALAELGALIPALKHPVQALWRSWMALAAVLEAAAGDALGGPDAADHALERALDLAEPDGLIAPFLLYPMPGLLDRHARHPTTHASLLSGSGTCSRETAQALCRQPRRSRCWRRSAQASFGCCATCRPT
jgi:LuxR family transcriptional regulator, maltose regulon positive regulatory protein